MTDKDSLIKKLPDREIKSRELKELAGHYQHSTADLSPLVGFPISHKYYCTSLSGKKRNALAAKSSTSVSRDSTRSHVRWALCKRKGYDACRDVD